jgi:hypothetical protein
MRATYLILLFATLTACTDIPDGKKIVVEAGVYQNQISQQWIDALQSRQSKAYIDSLTLVSRPMNAAEQSWLQLMQSKAVYWNTLRDSLQVPFNGINLKDTVYVLTGYLGEDDGFTYQDNTICFDLTAFQENYDSATLPENNNRIDRIFAHEYTHLLHKAWVKKTNLTLKNFKDSILWECLYEGIGMYRSLSKKWMLQNDTLPLITREALEKLYPVFVEKLIQVHELQNPSATEKTALNKNLSRGNTDKKWGAFPIAVWLMQEAKGEDKNLIRWIDGGPQSVIDLALIYLPAEHQNTLKNRLAKNL